MGVTRWRGSGGVEGWIFLALSPFHRSHVNSDYYFYCVCTQRFAENFSQAKIVLSGEKACSPDKSLSMVFPNVDYKKAFQFVNSGSYVGLAKHVKMMLEDVSADIAKHHSFTNASPLALDDQRWFTRYYLRNPAVAQLDVEGHLFHTLHDIKPSELSIRFKADNSVDGFDSNVTGISPCLIHGNGNGLTTFHILTDRLIAAGWPPNVSESERHSGATTSAIPFNAKK